MDVWIPTWLHDASASSGAAFDVSSPQSAGGVKRRSMERPRGAIGREDAIPVVFLDSFSVEFCRIFPSFTVSHTIRDQTGCETAQTSHHFRGAVRFQPFSVACRRKAMDMKTCGRRSTGMLYWLVGT